MYTDVADVQGLGVESPVFLGGFNVGRVSDVRPRVGPDGQLLFRVRMDVLWKLDSAPMPLNQGLRARVVPPPRWTMDAVPSCWRRRPCRRWC